MNAELADDHAPERMAGEHRRAILAIEHAAHGGYGLVEVRQRVLDRGDIQPCRLQPADHVCPARAIDEQAVDEDDVGCPWAPVWRLGRASLRGHQLPAVGSSRALAAPAE